MNGHFFFLVLTLLSRPLMAADGLRLVISGPSEVKEGETLELKATLVNDSQNRTYQLVMPGDGSDSGWRTPIVGWAVTEEASGQERQSGYLAHAAFPPERGVAGGRCGNINPFRESEIFSLPPGGKMAVAGFLDRSALASKKGKYRIKLRYENDPNKDFKGLALGSHSEEGLRKLRRTDAVELESNELIVNVR